MISACKAVGILELVYENVVEQRLEIPPRFFVRRQHIAELQEQIDLVDDLALRLHALVQRDDDRAETT
jgi:hypothetical protein